MFKNVLTRQLVNLLCFHKAKGNPFDFLSF